MRILVVGRALPSKENNMLGTFEFEQAQMLASEGHEVFYTSIDLRSIRHWRKFGASLDLIDGVNVYTLNIPIGRALPAGIRDKLYAPLRRYQLKSFPRRFSVPDIVSVHYPSLYPYDVFSYLQDLGSKITGTEHWSKVQNKELDEENNQYLREFVAKADAVTCVGSALKDAIIQITGTSREIAVIPNIVSPAFKYVEKTTAKDGFDFLAVGRLSAEKGYDKLIRAFCRTFGNGESVKLHIAGGGDEYEELQSIITQYGAHDSVIMYGIMSQEELAILYQKCDALVMPSDYETFGVPAAEAMACGLPVVVTRNTGIAGFVDDSNGIIINDNQIDHLANALKEIYECYKRYDSREIAEFAKGKFSREVVYKRIIDIYEKALNGDGK